MSVKVNVYKAPSSVSLSKTSLDLYLDSEVTLTAKLPSKSSSRLTWSSSNADVVTVKDGVITPVGIGSATITVKTFNGKKATCKVNVHIKPESILLDPAGMTVEYAGESTTLTPILYPEGSWAAYTYESSNPTVAIVTEKGVVKTKAAGQAIITVYTTVEGLTAEFTVDVQNDGRLTGLIIGIDPGHQRKPNYNKERIAPWSSETKSKVSSGTCGYKSRRNEYAVNLQVAVKLRAKLEALGATVYMTRESHDVNISNIQRAKMMNNYGAHLVLRLHCNGSSNHSTNGIVIYTPTVKSIKSASYNAGKCVLSAMCSATGAKKHTVNITDVYTGLNWSTVPTMLVEMGYMSNATEDKKLCSSDYQYLLAEGMTNGILKYFKR